MTQSLNISGLSRDINLMSKTSYLVIKKSAQPFRHYSDEMPVRPQYLLIHLSSPVFKKTSAMVDNNSKNGNPSRQVHVTCQDCSLARLCLPFNLDENELSRFDGIVKRARPMHKNDYLIRAGDPVQHVYALRSGSMKSYLLSPDGTDQIIGFHLPSELIGLDALGMQRHPSYAVALETSMICAIPVHQLEELAGQIPGLRKQLLQTLGREIHEEHEHYSHTRESAEQRLAAFLLNLSVRHSRRGLSASHFTLPMSRRDVANYLGLTTETVSRLFTRFRDLNLVAGRGHEVQLLDIRALCRHGKAAGATSL